MVKCVKPSQLNSNKGRGALSKTLREFIRKEGREAAWAGKSIMAFFEYGVTQHVEELRAEYEIGYRSVRVSERGKPLRIRKRP